MSDAEQTARELLKTWLEGPRDGEAKPYDATTRAGYETEVGSWLTYIGERVWTATPRDVDTWASHATGRTRAHYVSAVRSFYEHAAATGHLHHNNPALRSLRGSVNGLPTRRTLTRPEAAALISAADRYTATGRYAGANPHRDRALIYLLFSGIRPGAAVALLREGIHIEQHRTTADVPQKGGGTLLTELPPLTWLAVRDYLPHRRHKPPFSYDDSGPLLTGRGGRALNPIERPTAIVRTIAATHELLAPLAHELTPDGLAHSNPPW